MKQFVKDLVHSYEEPLKEIRHHLHENPELSHHEERTVRRILVPASPSGQISTLFLWKKTTISPINPKRPASCTPAAMTPMLPVS